MADDNIQCNCGSPAENGDLCRVCYEGTLKLGRVVEIRIKAWEWLGQDVLKLIDQRIPVGVGQDIQDYSSYVLKRGEIIMVSSTEGEKIARLIMNS